MRSFNEHRQVAVGEVEGLYKYKKRKYGQPIGQPKLKQSRRQQRMPSVINFGTGSRNTRKAVEAVKKKPTFIEAVTRSFRRIVNSPKNKVIIEWKWGGSERFAGVKTEQAAKNILSKKPLENIRKATWWDANREETNLLVLGKDVVTN